MNATRRTLASALALLLPPLFAMSLNHSGTHADSFVTRRLRTVQQPGDGTIVYERVPENSGPWPTIDIYSMNADGSDDRALTHDGHSHSPSWSPDGRRILFVHDSALEKPDPYGSYREHEEYRSHHPVELYEMNRDGSEPQLLKRFEPLIDGAAWSPNEKAIIIQAAAPPPSGISLFLWSPQGQGEPRLFVPYPAAWPAWSPDGKKILFVKRNGRFLSSPFIADSKGANVSQLRYDPGPNIFEPAWSPDGQRIAYTQDNAGPGETSQIFVMNRDGSGARQLTHDPNWEHCRHPSWSPDGKRVVFSCRSKTAPCRSPIADDGTPIQPWCVVRLFVVAPDKPSQTLTPVTDHYGASPAFSTR